jgi:hypothetical protein
MSAGRVVLSDVVTVVSALTAAARVTFVSSNPPGATTVLCASLAAASARSALRMKLANRTAVAKCWRAACWMDRLVAAAATADRRLNTACRQAVHQRLLGVDATPNHQYSSYAVSWNFLQCLVT